MINLAPLNESNMKYSFNTTSMKKIRETESILEKSASDFKRNNDTLICPIKEEELG